MKKLFYIIALASLGLTLATSCNSDKRQIKNVSKEFLAALDTYDFETCKKLCTQNGKENIEQLQNLLQAWGITYTDSTQPSEFKISEVIINGDEATASYYLPIPAEDKTMEQEPSPESTLKLKKVDGKWLVDYKKEGPAINPEGMDFNFGPDMDSIDVADEDDYILPTEEETLETEAKQGI